MSEIWDNTKLSAYTCDMRGKLGMEEHLVPNEPSEALAFGIGFHKAVEVWTQANIRGQHAIDVAGKAFLEVWEKELPQEKREMLEFSEDRRSYGNFLRLFEAYTRKFPLEMFDKIVAVEVPFTLYLGKTSAGEEVSWSGILDRSVEWQGGLYYVDIKTSSYPCDDRFFNQFRYSGQMLGYAWAGKELGIGNFAGVMIQGVEVKSPPKTSRGRTIEQLIQSDIIAILPEHVEEWKVDTLAKIDRIYKLREGGHYVHNMGHICNEFNGCAFRRICTAHPDIREKKKADHYKRREWNPLNREAA